MLNAKQQAAASSSASAPAAAGADASAPASASASASASVSASAPSSSASAAAPASTAPASVSALLSKYYSLLAKLAHSSRLPLPALAAHIKQRLFPTTYCVPCDLPVLVGGVGACTYSLF